VPIAGRLDSFAGYRRHDAATTSPGEATMTTYGNLFFWGVLGLVGMIAVLALVVGWWFYTIVAVVAGGCFAFAGPFVIGRRWRPPAPRPTKRPVVRRRR
jgi:hypothetical protein